MTNVWIFRWTIMLMAFLLAVSGAHAGATSDRGKLAEIIGLHTAARGGAEAIEAVRAIEVELHIVEPTFEVDGVYRATRDGKMRIDVYMNDERVFSEGYDGARGWQLPGGETVGKDMVAEGEAALRHGIAGNLYGLHEMASLGHSLKYIGTEAIDGVEYQIIDLVYAEGTVLRHYIDPRTWLVSRTRDERALHPDIDLTVRRFETIVSEYVEVAGVTKAHGTQKRDLDSGEIVQTTMVKKLTINPEIDQALFERPR